MATNQPTSKSPDSYRNEWIVAIVLALLGVAAITTTVELAHAGTFPFVTAHRDRLIAAEIAVFTVFVVEVVVRIANVYFRQFDVLPTGMSVRTIIRIVAYLIAGVAVISVLASNSAMAVGVGSATGVIIALTVQGLASNVMAGVFLATSRHVQKGSELTIMGKTGHLVEIRLIYTIIDTGEKLMFIPNSIMMSNAIEYKKELPRQ